MADSGHDGTEAILKEIEKRVTKEYRQAAAEVQEKLNDYWRRFRIKDEIKRKALKAGAITKQEYNQWRIGQIAIGKRWAEMQDVLARDFHNANNIARSIADGYMPEVYALNHNYGTFLVEKASLVDTSYSLYSREAVERLIKDQPDVLPPVPGLKKQREINAALAAGKDIRWQKGQIQSVMTQGILQGESIPNIARRIASTLGERNLGTAIRYARTAATAAQNAGREDSYKRAQSMGIKMRQMWVATLDDRTRVEHRYLDGQVVDVGEPFVVDNIEIEYPGDPQAPGYMIYNCFPRDTSVACDSGIVRSYKHFYTGYLIEIETANGAKFSCTPNHPILTPSGWMSAALLNKGDNILVTFVGNSVNPRGNPNIKHVHPSIGAIHDFMKFLFGFERMSPLRVNFHGDVPTTDVEVVRKKRFLRICGDSALGQYVDKQLLKFADTLLSCKRHFVKRFWGIDIAPFGLVSGGRKALSFLWRGICHSNVHRFGAVPNRDVSVTKYAINDLPRETEIRSELLNGLAGNVFVDKVVSVKVRAFTGHVYNLQTEDGYYFAKTSIAQKRRSRNGAFAIVKNCRCTTIPQLAGFEIDPRDLSLRMNSKLGDMTYEEWQKAKTISHRITKQVEIEKTMKRAYGAEYRRLAKAGAKADEE